MRKKIKFKITDGLKPTRPNRSGGFSIRCPIPISVDNKGTTVSLGISCDHPVMLFQPASFEKKGLIMGTQVIDADAEFRIHLISQSNFTFEVGEVVAKCHVLSDADVDVLDGK